MKGLIFAIYRTNGPDCTNNGESAKADEGLLIGTNIDKMFYARGRPIFRLMSNACNTVKLVPCDENGNAINGTAFGGNFGYSSDSRFADELQQMLGYRMYGAVPIHDHRITKESLRALD